MPWNQALARADSAGFLEGLWSARQAVPTPMPSSREMTFHEAPEARRLAPWRGLTATSGSLAPSAFFKTDPCIPLHIRRFDLFTRSSTVWPVSTDNGAASRNAELV